VKVSFEEEVVCSQKGWVYFNWDPLYEVSNYRACLQILLFGWNISIPF